MDCLLVFRILKLGRSREGAWIEIQELFSEFKDFTVAPVRERGLKLIKPTLNAYEIMVAPVRERGLK